MANEKILREEQIWNRIFTEMFDAIRTTTHLRDFYTNATFAVTPSGALEIGELIRIVGGNFENGPILTHKYDQVFTGSGGAVAVDGELVLSTGTVANSRAALQSVNRAIFNAATFNKCHQAIQTPLFDAPDVVRRWGMFDPAVPIYLGDGIYWENDSGVYTINRRKKGVMIETVNEVDFITPLTKGENLTLFEIEYNAGSLLFLQDRVLIYKMSVIDSAGYETVHLPIGSEIFNKNGNIVNHTIQTRGFACSRIGTDSSIPDKFLIDNGSPASAIIENSPSVFEKVVIGDVGVGGASVTFYDWNLLNPPASSKIITVSLTDSLQTLPMGFILNRGLVYEKTGAGFEVLAVTK